GRQGCRADGRPGRCHRRLRRRTAGLAAGSVGALQVSAVNLVRGAAAAHRYRQALQAGTDRQVFVTEFAGGVVVAVGSPSDDATFTLTEDDTDDRRAITVASVPDALAELAERCECWPQAAAVCDDALRSIDPKGPTRSGVVTESLAYSTLQSGPEFARWLAERGPATVPVIADPVQADRAGDCLHVRFNRPQRHNAFSSDIRAALLEALEVARLDPSITEVVLSGN